MCFMVNDLLLDTNIIYYCIVLFMHRFVLPKVTVRILLCYKKPMYEAYRLLNDSCYGYRTIHYNARLEKKQCTRHAA